MSFSLIICKLQKTVTLRVKGANVNDDRLPIWLNMHSLQLNNTMNFLPQPTTRWISCRSLII